MSFSSKPQKYYILNESGQYYYVNDGLVLTTAEPKEVQYPLGWQEDKIAFPRDNDMKGVFQQITTAYQFPFDGATILRYLYSQRLTEAKAQLAISYQNNADGSYGPPQILGSFDFGKYLNKETTVSIQVMEAGIAAKLKANFDVDYEIPIGDDAVNIRFNGAKLQASFNWLIPIQGVSSDIALSNVLQTVPSGSEGLEVGEQSDSFYQLLPVDASLEKTKIFTALIAQSGTISVTGNFFYLWPSSASTPAKPAIVANYGTPGSGTTTGTVLWEAVAPLSPGSSQEYNVLSGVPISLNGGNLLSVFPVFLQGGVSVTSSNSRFRATTEGRLIFKSTFSSPASTVKGYFYRDYVRKLVEKVCEATGVFSNGFFDETAFDLYARPAFQGVTSGVALRGLPNPTIKGSLKDVMQDISSIFPVGLAVIDNKVQFRRLGDLFQKETLIAELDNVKSYEEKPALDLVFNQVRFGYADVEYDELNGRYEPNSEWTRKMPTSAVNATLDKVASFKRGFYDIEYTRFLKQGKSTTDDASDNSTFGLQLTETSTFGLWQPSKNQVASATTGLFDPATTYNLEFMPNMNLRRIGGEIRSYCFGQEDKYINNAIAKKNANVAAKFLSTTNPLYTEKADILVSSLPQPFWKPVYATIETETLPELFDLIKANPYGYVRFFANGKVRKYFILNPEMQRNEKSSFNWLLLAHPECEIG